MEFNSVAQSFELSGTEFHYQGKVGDFIEIPVEIKNLTGKAVPIIIQQIDNNIRNDQTASICWGKDCAENGFLQKNLSVKNNDNRIVTGFEAGLSAGFSSVKYLIFNRNNPQDAVEFVIHFNIDEPNYNASIYTSDKIQIKEVYPNPVSDFLYINYLIKDDKATAKVSIHNVLGSVITEYDLEPVEQKAKINTTELNPGVYFYSLTMNNETVLIKKFVVRK